MFCKSCGRKIDDDSTFCSFCGIKQSTELKSQIQADLIESNNTCQQIHKNETNVNNSLPIIQQSKYDLTYKKEDDAINFGISLLAIPLISFILGATMFEDKQLYEQFRIAIIILLLIFRFFATFWIVNIAKRQNRGEFVWGVLGFLSPAIVLIVIATRKKLRIFKS